MRELWQIDNDFEPEAIRIADGVTISAIPPFLLGVNLLHTDIASMSLPDQCAVVRDTARQLIQSQCEDVTDDWVRLHISYEQAKAIVTKTCEFLNSHMASYSPAPIQTSTDAPPAKPGFTKFRWRRITASIMDKTTYTEKQIERMPFPAVLDLYDRIIEITSGDEVDNTIASGPAPKPVQFAYNKATGRYE